MSLPLLKEITLPDGTKYEQPTGMFVNNEYHKTKAGTTLETVNPTTTEVITEVYAAESEDVDFAVAAARKAYEEVWKFTDPTEKAALLRKLAELTEKYRPILNAIEAADSGKPRYTNVDGDIDEAVALFYYYGGWADKIQGKVIPVGEDKLAYTRHEPYGVCGQIIPWNYPICMAAWKLGPALATGNCVVLKLAEQTPLSMLFFGKIVKEAGFPPGVVNIITGYGKDAGAALASHTGVDKIAFTGSTATGKLIMKMAAVNIKAITLECGGKSPLIVFDDCDFEQAVKWARAGIMYNQGQVCSATSRIYVQESIYDKFVKALGEEIKKETKLGDPFGEDIDHGPQVTKLQQERVLEYITKGKDEGATVVTGGGAPKDVKGYYVEPTVFADVTPDMTISKEEIFGPVVTVTKFTDEKHALKMANDTSYGLGSAIFTENITKAHRVAAQIEAGMVWINSSNDSDYRVPFGGFKMSGVGTELGEYGLQTYTHVKAIHVNLGTKL